MRKKIAEIVMSVLFTAVLTGAGCWLAFGKENVSRDEMIRHVSQHAPWIVDEGEIRAEISVNRAMIGKLEQSLIEVLRLQRKVLVEQSAMSAKIDRVLKEED